MDIKTLEYMEARTKEARELIEGIERLKQYLEIVKGKEFNCLEIAHGSDNSRLTKWGSKQVENSYLSEVEAHMLNAFISVTEVEIKRLQKELDEL